MKYLALCLLALALSIPAVAQDDKPLSDETKALIEKAEGGDADAQVNLGKAYQIGIGVLLPPSGGTICVLKDEKEAVKWATLWQSGMHYPAIQIPGHLEQLQPLTSWAIKEAARTFPIGTGLGADNISPRALVRLSEHALSALAVLRCASESLADWIKIMDLVFIVLLPKADGGFRLRL